MKFGFDREARDRREFAERQISQINELLSTHPDAIPTLYPSYNEEVQQVADRLYVPNIELKNGTVLATTPRSYRAKNAIGVIAVRSGESFTADRWLVQPSIRQRQQQQRFLSTHSTTTHITYKSISMRDIQSKLSGAITDTMGSEIALSSRYGYRVNTPFFRDAPPFNEKPKLPPFVGFACMSPLAINMMEFQDPATLMHEVDHLVELDGSGVFSNDYIDNRAETMVLEQRGYHVGRVVGEYLAKRSLYIPPYLAERLSTMRDIDAIRTEHLGEGQFGFSHELVQSYHDAGLLDHMLPPDYQDKLRLR